MTLASIQLVKIKSNIRQEKFWALNPTPEYFSAYGLGIHKKYLWLTKLLLSILCVCDDFITQNRKSN